MTIKKFLCKRYDETNKGYVEGADLIKSVDFIFFMVIPFLIGVAYYLTKLTADRTSIYNDFSTVTNTDGVLNIIVKMWSVGIQPIIVIILFHLILKIKLLKCEKKEESKEELKLYSE